MDIDLTHFHSDHFRYGSTNLVLDIMTNINYIDVTFQDQIYVCIDSIVFNYDLDPVMSVGFKNFVTSAGASTS